MADWSRDLNRRLLAITQGDPAVTNPARLMRLPGGVAWPWKPGRVPEVVELDPEDELGTVTLDEARAALPAVPDETSTSGTAPSSTAELLNPVRSLIEQVKAGPLWHEPVLRLVAHLVGRGVPDCVILAMAPELTWPAYTVEQTRRELATMIEGARRRGFAPDESAANDDAMDCTPEPAPLFPLLDEAALAALPDPSFLIDGLLVADSLAVLYGAWASFKSFLALDFALCMATGTDWQGHKTERDDTLYIAAEGAAGLKLRIAAWKQARNVTESITGFRAVPCAVNLMDATEAERLILSVVAAQQADGFAPRVIVCDTVSRAMPGADENAKKDMSVFVHHADLIRRKLDGATFLAIHHAGKDGERGMRGSSDLPASADTILRMTRAAESMDVELYVEKQKDGEDGARYPLRAAKVELPPGIGTLKPRASLVLVQGEAKATGERSGIKPSRRPYYDALIGAITKSTVGPGRTTIETWQLECLRRGLIEKAPTDGNETHRERHTRYQGFRAAKHDLIAANWIAINDSLVTDLKAPWA